MGYIGAPWEKLKVFFMIRNLGSVLQLQQMQQRQAARERGPSKTTAQNPPDAKHTLAASGKSKPSLSEIQQKIASGFYNQDSVIDDISSGFASAFDKRI